MAQKAPGRSHREGISLVELTEMFPDEASAAAWFETVRWPDGRSCPHCGGTETAAVPNAKPAPYRCPECRSYFSVRTGSLLAGSRLPLRKWVFAVYLYVTSLKGVSSMKLHRDLGVTQKTAWFMLHRLREAWDQGGLDKLAEGFEGPVEVDETYMGGKRKNMPKSKRKALSGRGAVGKTPVVGAKDRGTGRVVATPVSATDRETLHGFVANTTAAGAKVYTDDAVAYRGMDRDHEAVNHSAGEYVRGMAHTNGIESFWSMLKRGYHGTYHQFSSKHMARYVNEFAGRHNVRDAHTIFQMSGVAAAMVGKRLMYRDLTA